MGERSPYRSGRPAGTLVGMDMRLSVAGVSVVGGREINEDAWHADTRLVVVADGVGGSPAGEVASRLAVDTVAAAPVSTDPVVAAWHANSAVRARSTADPDTAGMATTLEIAVLLRRDDGWWLRGAHVGDSVAFGPGGRLTEPHTLAAELVAAGHLTETQAARHPNRTALVRAVGMEAAVRPDAWERPAVPGERYLLCSDGLTDALGEAEVLSRLADLTGADPAACAHTLVRLACAAGARDNVTAVVADVTGGAGWPA
ncbi:PP2C family protein-serine/threonine phosphatase [Actinokineospora sp.]|uniref:PP2C family protein-serine/threonine phosphatase n=1 Tax=Actinokineospora sp. TaxID=1872133 RepID=UPI004037644A